MKATVIRNIRVFPSPRQEVAREEALPAIDAWYAFRRTLATIYIFDSQTTSTHQKLSEKLIGSLSETLASFPQLAGRLHPSWISVDGNNGCSKTVKRPKISWGGDADQGVDFTEASTATRLYELLPPAKTGSAGFLWDRSGSRLDVLFPRAPMSEALMRVQLTHFKNGGFALAVDADHGLADALVVGNFMQHWSTRFNGQSTTKLPDCVYYGSRLDDEVLRRRQTSALDARASCPPAVKRPFARDLDARLEKAPVTTNTMAKSLVQTPCLLHISAGRYKRITEEIQASSPTHITDHVAMAAFLWAVLNRARKASRPTVELHMAVSFRGQLNLPTGLIGSPFANIMLPYGSGEESTDATRLAVKIMQALDTFDEHAMRDLISEAMFDNSPDGSSRAQEYSERMTFTSAAHSGWDNVAFGRPKFLAPLLPWYNLFVMLESLGITGRNESDVIAPRWYRDGVNIFFAIDEQLYEAFASDPAFADFDKLQDI